MDEKDRGMERLKRDLAKSKKQNGKVIFHLMRIGVYLKFKTKSLLKTWRQSDSDRVREIGELNALLPPELQRPAAPADFTLPPTELRLHRLPPADSTPLPIRTEEVVRAERRLRPLFTSSHSEKDRELITFAPPRGAN